MSKHTNEQTYVHLCAHPKEERPQTMLWKEVHRNTVMNHILLGQTSQPWSSLYKRPALASQTMLFSGIPPSY
eukprot:1152346-Pelagomonas_calceolata.AAC.4